MCYYVFSLLLLCNGRRVSSTVSKPFQGRFFFAPSVARMQNTHYLCHYNNNILLQMQQNYFRPWAFSFFPAPVSNTRPSLSLSPFCLYRYIVSGQAADATAAIRAATEPEQRRELKRTRLAFCTPGCVVSRRALSGLLAYSGLMVLDFDHVATKAPRGVSPTFIVRAVFEPMFNKHSVVLGFVSPSGDGYKMIIDVSREMSALTGIEPAQLIETEEQRRTVAENYKVLFAHAKQMFEACGAAVDESGSDITRACYLPFDPYARINYSFLPRVW